MRKTEIISALKRFNLRVERGAVIFKKFQKSFKNGLKSQKLAQFHT